MTPSYLGQDRSSGQSSRLPLPHNENLARALPFFCSSLWAMSVCGQATPTWLILPHNRRAAAATVRSAACPTSPALVPQTGSFFFSSRLVSLVSLTWLRSGCHLFCFCGRSLLKKILCEADSQRENRQPKGREKIPSKGVAVSRLSFGTQHSLARALVFSFMYRSRHPAREVSYFVLRRWLQRGQPC